MDKHVLPRNIMRLVIALGVGALLFSLYLLPIKQLGIAFLLFALINVIICSTYRIQIPRGRGQIHLGESFILLALMLFGGEAAILLAAVAALCVSLRHFKNWFDYLFNAAATVVSAFVIIWTLRFTYGPVVEAGPHLSSLDFARGVCLTVLMQAAFNSTLILLDGAYQITQSVWRRVSGIYCWTFVVYSTGAAAACLVALVVTAMGLNAFMATLTSAAIVLFACRIYLNSANDDASLATRYNANLKESSERFRSAFDYAAIGMALVSVEGRWLLVNRSLCSLLGYTERELMATDFLTITHPDDLHSALANIKNLLQGKIPTYQMEKRYIHKEGHEVWVLWSVSMARDAYNRSAHLIFQIQDITDRKRAEERLLHDAFHDALTNLPNRALFMDHLKLAIARSQRNEDHRFAVLYIDLDRFKIINDSLGHMIGDQLLVGTAQRLEAALRPGDTIARLGGDEFTVLLEDIKDDSDVIYIAERIQKELTLPFKLNEREVFTTVSIGIALSSKDYSRAEEMLRDADTAMYRAKSQGRASYEIFDKAMHAHAVKLLQLETDLRRAVERQEFCVYYQPIVALETNRLCGFEALVRWNHPECGFISPGDFIPVAEETGLIVPIGEWVLRESCRQMQRWQAILPADPPLFMSVNLSGKQFAQPDLINRVASILKETGMDARYLKLEITESVVMENIETATEMLRQLRSLGARISIDDFGTGYSSLSYLHRFPINTLKIDRSFVTKMADNNENTEIVRTIVVLAQNLGMDVVAEGVETKEQLELLRSLGCENGQGYYFSRPVDSENAAKFIGDTYSEAMIMLGSLEQVPEVLIA